MMNLLLIHGEELETKQVILLLDGEVNSHNLFRNHLVHGTMIVLQPEELLEETLQVDGERKHHQELKTLMEEVGEIQTLMLPGEIAAETTITTEDHHLLDHKDHKMIMVEEEAVVVEEAMVVIEDEEVQEL